MNIIQENISISAEDRKMGENEPRECDHEDFVETACP